MSGAGDGARATRPAGPDEAVTHTALHVLKGAAVRVLGEGARWTAGTYVSGKHGRLTLKFDRKPTREEIAMVEEIANDRIAGDLMVEIAELPREEAERIYGDAIYDLFPVPDDVRVLRVVVVRDRDGSIWNVNACGKEHLESTGGIGRLRIGDARFRPSRGLLEIPFDVRA